MSNDPNSSAHERGPLGTYSDNATGSMWTGGKAYSAAEQTAAGINGFTDRATAEIIMATTQVGTDDTGGTVDFKALAIFCFIYLAALLMAFSLHLLGVPALGSISLRYIVFVTIAAFIFALVKNDSTSLSTKLMVAGGLVIAQSAFAIYNLTSAAFTGAVLMGFVVNAARITIGAGIIRGRAVARFAFVAVMVISNLSTLFTVRFSAHWSYVLLFQSPFGFLSEVVLAFLLFRSELRSGFK